MYEDYYAVAQNLPTLCEITYDTQGEIVLLTEGGGRPTGFRCRAFSALPGGIPRIGDPSKGGHYLPGRELHTSASLYADPVTLGRKSPLFVQPPPPRPSTGASNHILSSSVTTHHPPPHHAHPSSHHAFSHPTATVSAHAAAPPPPAPSALQGSQSVPPGARSSLDTAVSILKPRAKTALSLPNLGGRLGGGGGGGVRGAGGWGALEEAEEGHRGPGGEKLHWVESLNAWVVDKGSQNPVPYTHFVNSLHLLSRGQAQDMEALGVQQPVMPCPRYLSHMHLHDDQALAQAKAVKLASEKQRRQERARLLLAHQRKQQEEQARAAAEAAAAAAALAAVHKKANRVRFNKNPSPPPPAPPPVKQASPPPPPLSLSPPPSPPVLPAIVVEEEEEEEQEEEEMPEEDDEPMESRPASRESSIKPEQGSICSDESLDGGVKAPSPPPSPSPPPKAATPSPPPSPEPSPPTPKPAFVNSAPLETPKDILTIPAGPKPKRSRLKATKTIVVPKPAKKKKGSSKNKRKKPDNQTVNVEDEASLQMDIMAKDQSPTPSPRPRRSPHIEEEIETLLGLERESSVFENLLPRSASPIEEEDETKSPTPPRQKTPLKTQVEKRQRWRAQPKAKPATPPASPSPPPPLPEGKKTDDWIYGQEDFSEEKIEIKIEPPPPVPIVPELPKLPDPSRVSPPSPRPVQPSPEPNKKELPPDLVNQRWGMKKKDNTLAKQMEKERIAEERKKRAAAMLEKLRARKVQSNTELDGKESEPRFEDYGWLAQYCILDQDKAEMYRRAFDSVDEDKVGYLSAESVLMGMRGINRGLTDAEEEYVYRVLELTGYSITDGADFKLFALVAALSQKIAALDDWMRNQINRVDFKMLDLKLFMCKRLWEVNVDPETQRIPLSQLWVELRAGGVSQEHENEARFKLQHLHALDLFDFLTYVPLFIMVHMSVVENPLDDSRDK